MNKPVKFFIIGCLVILAMLLAAIVATPLLIDPNKYKPEIAAFVKQKTGRDVVIAGDIALSFTPWLGVTTGKITINNHPNFPDKAFATVDNSQIKLKLKPLLSGKVEVDAITLDGLALNLSQNQQGQTNWDDLTASPTQPQLPAPANNQQNAKVAADNHSQALAAFTIGAINITKGRVTWENKQTGKTFDASNIVLKSDKFELDVPLTINLTAEIAGNLFPLSGQVKATTALQLDKALNNVKLENSRFEWLGKRVAQQQPLVVTTNIKTSEINLREQTVKSSGLQLQAGDIKLTADITGEQIFAKPSLKGQLNASAFNLSQAMKQWGFEQPNSKDTKAWSSCSLTTAFHITPELLELTNLDATLDDSHAKGAFTINNFAAPAYKLDLAIDTLDLDRYLPPSDKPALTSPGFALAAGAVTLPLDWLKNLDANGKLAFGTLKINRMTLQDTHVSVSSKNGDVKISQSADRFYQGTYTGNLAVTNTQKPQLTLQENLTNIQLEPYLQNTKGKAKLGGTLTASADLTSTGNKTKELFSNLSGKVSFFLRDGFIHGFSLEKMLAQAKAAVINGKEISTKAAADRTAFSDIKGTINIDHQQLNNSDLIVNTATFQSKGQGSAALETGQLDYTLTSKLLKAQTSANTPIQLHDTPIVIHISGTLDQPSFRLDVGALLTDKNKAKLQSLVDHNKNKIEKLLNKLDKKTGSDVKNLLKKLF